MSSIDTTSSHYKGKFNNIYEVQEKYPNGGVAGDYVDIAGWAHYWEADRGTWCVNEKRDEYWDELLTSLSTEQGTLKDSLNTEATTRGNADKSLWQAVNALGLSGFSFLGVAVSDTDPGEPDGNVFYLATVKGEYKNFRTVSTVNEETIYGTVKVDSGEIALLLYKGYGTSAATDDDANSVKTGWKKITLNLDNIQRAVTQEDYDKLVSEGKVDENTYYNILEE